jgi:putative endonuclease
MASNSGTLYVGVTNNLERRVFEHKTNLIEGFSSKYGCHKLVYFEETTSVEAAITREKQVKKWRREKKAALIKNINPTWRDLSGDF